jgi:hemerythrin superfamily protein
LTASPTFTGALAAVGGHASWTSLPTEETVVDAIALLKADHKEIERLFKAFERAGDRAKTTKAALVSKIVGALSAHAAVEEQLFYPAVRAEVEQASDYVLDSLEEHHVVTWLCAELDGMRPDHERFDSKVRVLIENVRYHVAGEEHELLPVVRSALGRKRLTELGAQMEQAKRVAPTHPHPRIPDVPPGIAIAGAVAGAVDRARDVGKKVFDEARHMAS